MADMADMPESNVLLIMTGGTICMRQSPMGFVPARGFQEHCLAPMPAFNDRSPSIAKDVMVNTESGGRETVAHPSLRTPPTAYGRRVRYTVYEFEELLDSSSIDAKGWTQIARTIERNYTLFDGFVVLHGTDSLAYTCSALSFMLRNLGKPVVLTGSQAPMLELQNDATDNLLGSLVVAGHFMIPEVCLYFNNRLFRGNRAVKVSASDFAAFDSPNCAPLAVTTSTRTNVNWELVQRPRGIEHFKLQTDLDTKHVACLRIFPGITPEMLDAVLRLGGLRGLVLETFGAGNAPHGQDNAMTRVLEEAIQRGIVIVNITQCTPPFPRPPGILMDVMLMVLYRPYWKCQPRLRHRHESLARRGGGRAGHDDGSRTDQTSLSTGRSRSHAAEHRKGHGGLAARRADGELAAGISPSGQGAAGASADADDAGICDCAGGPGADPADRADGASVSLVFE